MLGTLLFVVFCVSLKMPSFDEHYREIIGFGYRLALSLILLAASLGLVGGRTARSGAAKHGTSSGVEPMSQQSPMPVFLKTGFSESGSALGEYSEGAGEPVAPGLRKAG